MLLVSLCSLGTGYYGYTEGYKLGHFKGVAKVIKYHSATFFCMYAFDKLEHELKCVEAEHKKLSEGVK